jgi:outer membrane protein assembly factor BamB
MAFKLSFKSRLLLCVISLAAFAVTGVADPEAAPSGVLKWKAAVGSPAQQDAALSAAGDPIFRYETGYEGMPWPMTPAVGGDGTVYFGVSSLGLFALNSDGTNKWTYQITSTVESPPALAEDGTIYFGAQLSDLYALNPDGSEKWVFSAAEGEIVASPAIGEDGTVYVGSTDGYFYAVNTDGTLKWKYQTRDAVLSSAAIDLQGNIYFGSVDNHLYALTPDGICRWRFRTGDCVNSSPAIGGDGTVYVGSLDGNLYAINPDGTLKWRGRTGDGIISSPVIDTDGTIYVGSLDGKLYAINDDGSLEWNLNPGVEIWSTPAIGADGTVYFCGSVAATSSMYDPGNYLFAVKNGAVIWGFAVSDLIISSPAISDDGIIYFGTVFGNERSYLYAIDSGTGKGLAQSPWPKFQGDARNTGRVAESYKFRDDLVSVTYVPVSEDEEVIHEDNVILSGDGTGILTESPKYLAPFFVSAKYIVTDKNMLTSSHDFTLSCSGIENDWGGCIWPFRHSIMDLLDASGNAVGPSQYVAIRQDKQDLLFNGSLNSDDIDYVMEVAFAELYSYRGDVYAHFDSGGYAGAEIVPQASTCQPLKYLGSKPGIGAWIRTGVFEISWKSDGDSLTVEVVDKTHGIVIPSGLYPDDNNKNSWGFMPAGTYTDFYDEMQDSVPVDSRSVQMAGKIHVDNTAEFALWVNGLAWAFNNITAMPAPGTLMTITNAYGEWNYDKTEFTQYTDPPYPGDSWQIEVQAMQPETEVTLPSDVTLTCGRVSAEAGATAEVTISLDNSNFEISGGQFVVVAEPADMVTFCGVSSTDRTDGWSINNNTAGQGELVLFFSESGENIAAGTEGILTLCYQLSGSFPSGDTISLTLTETGLIDGSGNPLVVKIINGLIVNGPVDSSGESVPGDVNSDGVVNILDVIEIVRFALGKKPPSAEEFDYADINSDGLINISDVIACMYIALGRNNTQLAAASGPDPDFLDPEQLESDLLSLGADLVLIDDVFKLLSQQPVVLPKAFSLGQNSPNPFNPSTTVSYSVPEGEPTPVSLKIYDLRGRLVRTLVDETREAGEYSVIWEGKDASGRMVSSGVYLYRIKAGDFVQTRKMVLLK